VISGLVLAAGEAKRYGRTKQLVEVAGKPLVQHAIDAAHEAALDEIVIVLGHDARAVAEALHLPPQARTVVNLAYSSGIASSLAVGLSDTGPESEASVVLLADQPGIGAGVIEALVLAFRARSPRIVRASFRDGPGPSLLSREIYAEATHLSGDEGARRLAIAHPDWVEEVAIPADAPVDVDTPQDRERVREAFDR
jgi:CTP:molybdopterin cytidylyltransferase MocA